MWVSHITQTSCKKSPQPPHPPLRSFYFNTLSTLQNVDKTTAASLLSGLAALTCFSRHCSVDTGPQATLGQTLCGKPRSSPGVKFVYKSLNFVASDSLCLQLWKFPHKGHYTIHRLQLSPSSERLKQVFLNSFHFALVKQ